MRFPRVLNYDLKNTVYPRGTSGGLADVMSFLIKGGMLRPAVAERVTTMMTATRQGALAKVGHIKFIGRSSDNLCVVHATLPCKIHNVTLDDKLKTLPKDIQNYYVQSAVSDALMKARRMVYEESEDSRRKALTYLYQELQDGEDGIPLYQLDPENEIHKFGDILREIIADDINEPTETDYRSEVMEATRFPGLDQREIEAIRMRVTKEREEKAKRDQVKKQEESETFESQKELESVTKEREERMEQLKKVESDLKNQDLETKANPEQILNGQETKKQDTEQIKTSVDLSDLINEIKS